MYEHGAIGRKFSFHEAVSAFIQLSIRRIKGKVEKERNLLYLQHYENFFKKAEIIGIGYDER